MEIVNINYRGNLNQAIDLEELAKIFSNSEYYPSRPCMVRIKDEDATILFFNSGKFRVMGCKSLFDALFSTQKYIKHVPVLKIQSMTAKMKLDYEINVYKLAEKVKSFYEPELFPAVTITKYRPAIVNVFKSGVIIVCGVKKLALLDTIAKETINVCSECKL